MQFYNILDQNSKSVLLDVIAELGPSVGPEILCECSKQFKEKSRKILVTTGGPKPSPSQLVLEDATETRKLLTCLGILSAFETDQHQVIFLLSHLPPSNSAIFSIREKTICVSFFCETEAVFKTA
jgi:hypothetical protein